MATIKVSALTAKTTPAGTEELLINDSGVSKKITIANLPDTDTTYSNFAGTTAGLVPTSTTGDDTKFLRADGTWVVPTDTDTNTTYTSSDFTHNSLSGVTANEHIDWTTDQGATNIHAGNYTDTDTGITDVVDDTTPQLGGDLDFQTHKATSFTSTGIDDNATSTAITIDSSENVGIKDSTPQAEFSVTTDGNNGSGHTTGIQVRQNGYSGYKSGMSAGDTAATTYHCGFIGFIGAGHTGSGERHITFETREGTTDIASTERLRITSDGRGLSPFTAKAWVNFNGSGTPAVNDSHNVSSITDNGTGSYYINLSNAMGNTSYVTTAMSITGNSNASSEPNTSSQITFLSRDINGNQYDWNPLQCLVFGD